MKKTIIFIIISASFYLAAKYFDTCFAGWIFGVLYGYIANLIINK